MKKKNTETPPAEPAAETSHGTHEPGWMPPAEPGTAAEFDEMLEKAIMEQLAKETGTTTPPTPKRTRAPYVKRTKAQIKEEAEKERIARLDPVEAMEEELKALDAKIDIARVNQELADTTVRELVSQREQYVARKKAEIDEIVIRAARALKLE